MKVIKGKFKKNGGIFLLLAVFFILINLSCQSQQVSLMVKGPAYSEMMQGDVTLAVRYMSEAELVARHGQRANNPFISSRYLFFDRQIVVFELKIQNMTAKSLELQAETINMNFDSKLLVPVDLFNFENHWHLRDTVEKTNKKVSQLKQKLIRDYVLPASITIEPNGHRSGYIVFMTTDLSESGQYGYVLLSIPLLTPQSNENYDFLFQYSFLIYHSYNCAY